MYENTIVLYCRIIADMRRVEVKLLASCYIIMALKAYKSVNNGWLTSA